MKYPGRRSAVRTCLCLLALFGGCLEADDQSWVNNALTLTVNPRWNIRITNELRYFDITGLTPYLRNIQGGLVYRLTGHSYTAFLYKRELVEKGEPALHENRFTWESGWKTKLGPRFDLDLRFRTEARRFEDGLSRNHLRFRLRFRIRTQMVIGKLTLKPFIGTEPFADNMVDEVFRNRFYLGTLIPFSNHVEMVLNYIRQDTEGKDTNHILNTGFSLKY